MNAASTLDRQTEFYREFLMARGRFDPHDFGVDMDREKFTDTMAEEFNAFSRGQLTVDEMLLRPRTAMQFCESVRQKYGWYDVPDDIILRSVMTRRKNP